MKKAISLVVLVIVIVIMIILTTAITLSLMENNVLDLSYEAKVKMDFKNMELQLQLYISENLLDSEKGEIKNVNAAPKSKEIYNMIPAIRGSEYDGYVYVHNGKIVIKKDMVGYEHAVSIVGDNEPFAQMVNENPETYYTKIVNNYTTGNDKIDETLKNKKIYWQIYHADNEYIFNNYKLYTKRINSK